MKFETEPNDLQQVVGGGVIPKDGVFQVVQVVVVLCLFRVVPWGLGCFGNKPDGRNGNRRRGCSGRW